MIFISRFKLEETVAAFETAKTGAGGAIKVMIKCWKQMPQRNGYKFYYSYPLNEVL